MYLRKCIPDILHLSFTNSNEAKKIDVCHVNHIIKSVLGLLGNENSHSREIFKKTEWAKNFKYVGSRLCWKKYFLF